MALETFRVGVKVPPFYAEKPALWFAQLEGQFQLANITADGTKFFYAIGQLEPQYAAEVEDVITSPPTNNKYDKLKSELIKRLSASREKKLKQLLDHEQIGDRKPSAFLRYLQNLAGPGVPDEFLRTIWTSRLPSGTQTIIASQPRASLDELAELADRVHDVVSPCQQVASTSRAAPSGSRSETVENQIAELTKQVAALTNKITQMSRDGHRRAAGRNRSRSRSRNRSHSNYRKYPNCWYHAKFGGKADRCVKPCDFGSGNSTGNR
ncbi:PREDICTED: uncharacterized protein LOC106118112 [Papilio xuthus]|uniref:Uncharacterized protein LOC106118112 n=1 Tax=Papilio xuthus TaxID=66420 RepID=A0AAJ6ZA69_PAPXU|nr:PREDICTED: uncharacterized protein LOC106118112 [Papilio xuthus]